MTVCAQCTSELVHSPHPPPRLAKTGTNGAALDDDPSTIMDANIHTQAGVQTRPGPGGAHVYFNAPSS
jgi:hypothetical protein